MGGRGADLKRSLGTYVLKREKASGSPLGEGEPASIPGKDFGIGRSLSARAKNYDIKDPKTGKVYHFVEGSTISDVEVFAGKGVRNKLRPEVVFDLHKNFGGRPKNWQHVKGMGTLDFNGRPRDAEIHWFQESSTGEKVKFKIKRWLER